MSNDVDVPKMVDRMIENNAENLHLMGYLSPGEARQWATITKKEYAAEQRGEEPETTVEEFLEGLE